MTITTQIRESPQPSVRLHSVTRPSGPKRTKRISQPVRFISGDLIWQIVTPSVRWSFYEENKHIYKYVT